MEEKFLTQNVLPVDYNYMHVESHSTEEVYRIREVRNADEADEWIRKLSYETKTTWRVSRTYPYAGTINVYRKDYRCQHSTDRRATGARSSKNTNCPAMVKIIIKRHKKKSKLKKVDRLIRDYPAEVIIRGEHNHSINSADFLRRQDLSEDTKNKLSALFRLGHTPSSALQFLKMDLMLEYPDNYDNISVDSTFLPSSFAVCKFFKNEFENDFRYLSDDKLPDNVEELFKIHAERSGGRTKFQKTEDGCHSFVVIISRLMVRCHLQVKQCSEVVFLDFFGGTDKQKLRTYFFVTPTACGGLPLGIIITDCAEEYVFTEALLCYKELLSEIAFYSVGFPKFFMTDYDMIERTSLKKIFPKSSLLSNQLHLFKSFWSWLCSRKQGISSIHRQKFFNLFKKIAHSCETEEADENMLEFILAANELENMKLTNHFLSLWDIRNDWVSCFRKELIETMHENNTGILSFFNNFEIVFRILKDIIFDRTTSYNLLQLIDFIISKYEAYLKYRLVAFSNGKSSNSILLKFLAKEIDINSFSMDYDPSTEIFQVLHEDETYNVDMVLGRCSCGSWKSSKICVHTLAVFLNMDSNLSTLYKEDDLQTKNILQLLTGLCDNLEKLVENEGGSTDDQSTPDIHGNSPTVRNIDDDVVTETQLGFKNLMRRIQDGLSSNPNGFVPALKKMLRNAKSFTSTDNSLISAMCTFGTNTAAKSDSRKSARNAAQSYLVDVQTRKNTCKKVILTGRKNLTITRPLDDIPVELVQPQPLGDIPVELVQHRPVNDTLVELVQPQPVGDIPVELVQLRPVNDFPVELVRHNYTVCHTLSKRKRKAQNNLEKCVVENKSRSSAIKNRRKNITIKSFKVL